MSLNYLEAIDIRLHKLFAEVSSGKEPVDRAVAFVKDEIRASYRRGRRQAERPTQNGKTEAVPSNLPR